LIALYENSDFLGIANFGVSDAMSILQESEFYLLDDPYILNQCAEVLKEKLAPENCVEIFELASKFHILNLKGKRDINIALFTFYRGSIGIDCG
jgi:hypothetical protein